MYDMQINKLQLEDRSFLIQFNAMIDQFGDHIPWFNEIKPLRYLTDPSVLKQELLTTLNLDTSAQIIPYMLSADSPGKEYVGSVLLFSSSPEHFMDPKNEILRNQLEQDKYAYLSCLQIRDVFRTARYGTELLSKSTDQIFKEFTTLWFVVEDPRLIKYYQYFGADMLTSFHNQDGISIMSVDQRSFKKRH